MLVKEILWSARFDYLDDAGNITDMDTWYAATRKPLWPDATLLRHLNTAQNEWAKETGCFRDHLTEAICKILILANKHTYTLDSRITEIHEGYLNTAAKTIYPQSLKWFSLYIPLWRTTNGDPLYLLPDYDQGYFRLIYYPGTTKGYWSGAVTFTAGTKTIAQTGGLFSNYLADGDQVVISGTTSNGTTAVPATFTVATAGADSFTVDETVVGESASAAIIQKVTDTMWLTVSRLPLNQLTLAGIATESPEIRSEYHPKLIYGILREAYGKQDSQTLDVQKEEKYRNRFEAEKAKAKFQRDSLRASEETMKPHPGAI